MENNCSSCLKAQSRIQVLCLDPGCEGKRKICVLCFEKNHSNHENIFLHKTEQLFAKLSANKKNSEKVKYQKDIKQFLAIYQQVKIMKQQNIAKLEDTCENLIQELKTDLIYKLQIYFNSFEQEKKENFMFRIQHTQDEKELKKLIAKIKIAQGLDLKNFKSFLSVEKLNIDNITTGLQNFQAKIKEQFNLLKKKFTKKIHPIISINETTKGIISMFTSLCSIQSPKLSAIEDKISRLNPKHLRCLSVTCRSHSFCLNKNCFQKILTFKNLEKLSLTWAKKLKQQHLCLLFHRLPKLQYLSIPGSCIRENVADSLIQHLPALKQFHYLCDFNKQLHKYTEGLYFLGAKKIQNLFSLSIESCQNMSLAMQNLKTMWIGKCTHNATSEILTEMKNRLQDLILGQFDQIQRSLDVLTVNGIGELTKLSSLMLILINNDETDLIPSFTRLRALKTIILIKCIGIRDKGLKKLGESNPSVEKMAILNSSDLIGTFFMRFMNLKELYLSDCHFIDKKNMASFFNQNTKLQYLSLQGNKWADDSIMADIGMLLNLKYLNLGSTGICWKLNEIHRLVKLKILILSATQVPCESLRILTAELSEIEKLNLGDMNGENQTTQLTNEDLTVILKNLSKLTHLVVCNIYNILDNCIQITDKSFEYMPPSLRCIWLTNTGIKKRECMKSNDIYLIE